MCSSDFFLILSISRFKYGRFLFKGHGNLGGGGGGSITEQEKLINYMFDV